MNANNIFDIRYQQTEDNQQQQKWLKGSQINIVTRSREFSCSDRSYFYYINNITLQQCKFNVAGMDKTNCAYLKM